MKLLIVIYIQITFELILTSNKAPTDNLKKHSIFSNGRHFKWRARGCLALFWKGAT